jgi:hypothetical protein
MAENKYKAPEVPQKIKKGRATPKRSPALTNGLNMTAFYLFNNIHFIFYVAFLGIIYIANSHYAVETIKEIKGLQKELKTTSWESNSKKSELMYQSMESIVSQKVHHLGLRELEDNPKKIIDKKENK